jgi:hypothetical protein
MAAARARAAWNQPPPTDMPKPIITNTRLDRAVAWSGRPCTFSSQTVPAARTVANRPGARPPTAALISTAGTNSRKAEGAVKPGGRASWIRAQASTVAMAAR